MSSQQVSTEQGWRYSVARPSLPEIYRSLPIPESAGFLRKLLAFAGMSVALVLYASIVTYWRPRRSPPQGFDVISRDAPFDGISERHPS